MWGAAQLWNYLGKGHWLMEGSGRGGQSFWKLSVEFGLVGMCPRLRMVHQSARLKNIDRRKAWDTPWPCKEESQPRAHSNRVWCLQRDQRPLDLHAPELKQTSLPRTLLNSCYYILEKKSPFSSLSSKEKTKTNCPWKIPHRDKNSAIKLRKITKLLLRWRKLEASHQGVL